MNQGNFIVASFDTLLLRFYQNSHLIKLGLFF